MNVSLKFRLALLVALGTAIVSGAAAYGVWSTVRQGVGEQIDTMLRSPGRRLTERTGWNTDWKRFNQSLTLIFGDDWNADGICRVVGHGPRFPVYYESPNWPEDIMIQHPDEEGIPVKDMAMDGMFQVREPFLYDTETLGETHWRMANLANSDLTIHLGVKTNTRRDSVRLLATQLGMGAGALTCFMFGLTWLVARQALRPVDRIAKTAESITGRQLDQRIDTSGRFDAEFSKLITVFNEMIGRLERSFHQSARFSADASHELKTPVTNLFAEVTTRLNQCEPGSEEQRFLAGMVHELDRIRAVLGGLLLLSKADSGLLDLSREDVDFAEFLNQVGEDYSVMAEDAGLRFESQIELATRPRISADPVMLTQAMHNLLRNAVEYNESGGFVRIVAKMRNGQVEVRITNSGPRIEESLQPELFGRFRKGANGGHGLGLNIVREIIEAHDGFVGLRSSTDRETCFELRLPVEAESDTTGNAGGLEM